MIDVKILPATLQRWILKYRMKKNDGKLYRILEGLRGEVAITCLVCGQTSHHLGDVKNRFCIECGYHHHITERLQGPKWRWILKQK